MTSDQEARAAFEALKPCPFCGHVGLDFSEGSTFRWIVASCGGCGATTGETRIQTIGEGTCDEWMDQAKRDAIAAWNRRQSGPVLGYATHHDEPMLFPTREEAQQYCDDDEEPIPLVAASLEKEGSK